MSPEFIQGGRAQGGVRAVLLAAGAATRMAAHGAPRKPLIELQGRSILEHSCAAFDRCPAVTSIVIVAHPEDVSTVRELCARRPAFRKVHAVVAGGAQRGDSVRLGIQPLLESMRGLEPSFELIAVHDAARPFVRTEAIARCIEGARLHAAALLAIPVRDTLKQSADGCSTRATLDRSKLWAAQTPQVFQAAGLRECHRRALGDDLQGTDDAALWEQYRGPVQLVLGHWDNLKITEAADLLIAEALLSAASAAQAHHE